MADSQYAWAIAVAIALCGASLNSLGLSFQKLSLNWRANGAKQAVFISMWLLGFLGQVFASVCDFSALAFGAQSIVAPIGSWTLVVNVLFAPWFLGEKISRHDIVATSLIVVGCVVAVSTASHDDPDLTLQQLFALYRTVTFAVYASCIGAFIVGVLVAIWLIERVEKAHGPASPEYLRFFKFHRFSYSCISGFIGAQSVLFAKTLVGLLKDSVAGGPLFLANWQSYPILLGVCGTIGLQVYWMQCGLLRWDALYCVPIYCCFWILITVVGGGTFYHEFNGFTVVQATLFPFGIVVCVVGVYLLSQRAAQAPPQAADSDATEKLPLLGGTGAGAAVHDDDDAASGGTDIEMPPGPSAATQQQPTYGTPPHVGGGDDHHHQHYHAPPPASVNASLPPDLASVGRSSSVPTASILMDRRHTMLEDPMQGLTQLGMLMQPSASTLPMEREASEMLAHRDLDGGYDGSGPPGTAAAAVAHAPKGGVLSGLHRVRVPSDAVPPRAGVIDATPLLQAAHGHGR